MKIEHNIQVDPDNPCRLVGRILETIFEEGEERNDAYNNISEDGAFSLMSADFPELLFDTLFVFGASADKDNKKVKYTYESPEEAQQNLDYINEFTVKEKIYLHSQSNTATNKGCMDKEETIKPVSIDLSDKKQLAILVYDLQDVEAKHDYELATKANDMYHALIAMSDMLRTMYKYEEHTEEGFLIFEKIRDNFHTILNEYSLNEDI